MLPYGQYIECPVWQALCHCCVEREWKATDMPGEYFCTVRGCCPSRWERCWGEKGRWPPEVGLKMTGRHLQKQWNAARVKRVPKCQEHGRGRKSRTVTRKRGVHEDIKGGASSGLEWGLLQGGELETGCNGGKQLDSKGSLGCFSRGTASWAS